MLNDPDELPVVGKKSFNVIQQDKMQVGLNHRHYNKETYLIRVEGSGRSCRPRLCLLGYSSRSAW